MVDNTICTESLSLAIISVTNWAGLLLAIYLVSIYGVAAKTNKFPIIIILVIISSDLLLSPLKRFPMRHNTFLFHCPEEDLAHYSADKWV